MERARRYTSAAASSVRAASHRPTLQAGTVRAGRRSAPASPAEPTTSSRPWRYSTTAAARRCSQVVTSRSRATGRRIASRSGVARAGRRSATGMDRSVLALTVFDDGTGSALYAGGLFHSAGGAMTPRIAKWNGTIWSTLGNGLTGGGLTHGVFALTVFDDGSGSGALRRRHVHDGGLRSREQHREMERDELVDPRKRNVRKLRPRRCSRDLRRRQRRGAVCWRRLRVCERGGG